LTRPSPPRTDPWYSGRWLAWLFCALSFATAPLGTGLLNAIPQTATMLMFAGWIAAPRIEERRRARIAFGGVRTAELATRHA
jgi:hypothetical protein